MKWLQQWMTFRLARALYKSLPRHPMFWYDYSPTPSREPLTPRQRLIRAGLVILLVISACPIMAVAVLPGAFTLLFIVMLGGTIAGLHAANGISGLIGGVREQGRYDLVGVTPEGIFGLSWALGARFLRMQRGARRLRRLILSLYIAGALLVGLAAVMLPFFQLDPSMFMGTSADFQVDHDVLYNRLLALFNILLLLAFVRLDYTQSMVSAALIGMVAPTMARRRVDASIMGFGLFLGLQFGVYVVIFLVDFTLLGAVLDGLGVNGIITRLVLVGLALALREGLLHWMWRVVADELNTSLPELERFAGFMG